jgi:hypothetical protein
VDADKEQIAEVLIRYATGIDSKGWPGSAAAGPTRSTSITNSWGASQAPTHSLRS